MVNRLAITCMSCVCHVRLTWCTLANAVSYTKLAVSAEWMNLNVVEEFCGHMDESTDRKIGSSEVNYSRETLLERIHAVVVTRIGTEKFWSQIVTFGAINFNTD